MRLFAATEIDVRWNVGCRCFAVMVCLASLCVTSALPAQQADPEPKYRTVELRTNDGLKLRAFYFPSDKGKQAKTVLLVHEWRGQASPYRKLVEALQKSGCAVLVPDYRGHGGSRKQINNRGQLEEMDAAQMSKSDIEKIIKVDLEKAKAFLKDENNKENLNLNALVVVGIGEGCVMAAHWAARDWSFQTVGRLKRGQDVKGLVFISPAKQVKGVPVDAMLSSRSVLLHLPIMIVSGAESANAEEAERIAKRVEAAKKKLQRESKVKGFEFKRYKTGLNGVSLVTDISAVIPAITKFIETEIKVSDRQNPWLKRE